MSGTKVEQVRNELYVPNGTKAYVAAMVKWGMNPTMPGPYYLEDHHDHHVLKDLAQKLLGKKHRAHGKKLKKKAPDGSTSEVPATDQMQDAEYTVPVMIGSPAQTLMLDFDTGSSDLWVLSDELSASTKKGLGSSHHVFNHKASGSFKMKSGESWRIEYGDGSSASGNVGTDIVRIGNITIPSQGVELADTISSTFVTNPSDGLLGLAFPLLNTVLPMQVATPVENMINQKLIPKGLFTAHLGTWRHPKSTDAGNSYYTFGYIDNGSSSNGAQPYGGGNSPHSSGPQPYGSGNGGSGNGPNSSGPQPYSSGSPSGGNSPTSSSPEPYSSGNGGSGSNPNSSGPEPYGSGNGGSGSNPTSSGPQPYSSGNPGNGNNPGSSTPEPYSGGNPSSGSNPNSSGPEPYSGGGSQGGGNSGSGCGCPNSGNSPQGNPEPYNGGGSQGGNTPNNGGTPEPYGGGSGGNPNSPAPDSGCPDSGDGPDSGSQYGSEIGFGIGWSAHVDAAKASAPYYTPVDNSMGFWEFASESFAINGISSPRTGNTAIADTGTTLCLVDDDTCQAIYAAIPGATYDNSQQGYVFPNSIKPSQLPVVSFAIGTKQFKIPKEALAFGEGTGNTWFGGIQSRGELPFDIFGDTLLKGITAIFDQSNVRFGAIQRPDMTGSTLAKFTVPKHE